MHSADSTLILPCRRTEHQVFAARGARDVGGGVEDHLSDLCGLLVRVRAQLLPPVYALAAIASVASVERHRTTCCAPITERTSLD
jgi:hypothetical protein